MEVQILELKNKLPDDVLKIVSRFMGYMVHPSAEILKPIFEEHCISFFRFRKNCSFIGYSLQEMKTMIKIKSIPERRKACVNLRGWKRRYILLYFPRDFLPLNAINLRFVKSQMLELGFKNSHLIETWYELKMFHLTWFVEED
jgi:hypothetical protein